MEQSRKYSLSFNATLPDLDEQLELCRLGKVAVMASKAGISVQIGKDSYEVGKKIKKGTKLSLRLIVDYGICGMNKGYFVLLNADKVLCHKRGLLLREKPRELIGKYSTMKGAKSVRLSDRVQY